MKTLQIAALLAGALAATAAVTAAQAADTARYQVRFDATWTAETHPLDYPSNAHFSGLVGATHGTSYAVFADGQIATPGLVALSEKGAHSPLDSEIRAKIEKGAAGALFESGALFRFPGSIMAEFTADEAHPYVSVAAMVAPSPDWFTGVSAVDLRAGGRWADRLTLPLYAWDSGADSGTTYAAPDADTQPRQSVRINVAPQFLQNGTPTPVGTVTFTRIKSAASR